MSGGTTQYVLDLPATLPVVVSDIEAVCLFGLDIIAQQQAERQYYFHDGLGSVRHPSARRRYRGHGAAMSSFTTSRINAVGDTYSKVFTATWEKRATSRAYTT